MINAYQSLVAGLSDPAVLFGHFTYFLLIVSMLMRRMVWLRSFAVLSGLTKIIYRGFFVIDPVSVLWEAIFVAVNIGQLIVIWYYERHHRFAETERHFADSMPSGVERQAIRRLLNFSKLREVAAGETLMVEGQPVRDLMYIADGVAKIERNGIIFAVCGPGDYLGEMSFLTGEPATATVTAVKTLRVVSFEQERLRAAIDTDSTIRRAMESGLNRNLVGKLLRSNAAQIPVS